MNKTSEERIADLESRLASQDALINIMMREIFQDNDTKQDVKNVLSRRVTLRGVVNQLCQRNGFSGVPKAGEGYAVIPVESGKPKPGYTEFDDSVKIG